jgi:hypothetical protein
MTIDKLKNSWRTTASPVAIDTPRLNRRQRRAKAAAQGHRVDRRVAVHEAGHACGRVLVAGSLGWDIAEIISSVEIHAEPIEVGAVSQDGLASLRPQATTFHLWRALLARS